MEKVLQPYVSDICLCDELYLGILIFMKCLTKVVVPGLGMAHPVPTLRPHDTHRQGEAESDERGSSVRLGGVIHQTADNESWALAVFSNTAIAQCSVGNQRK